MHVCAATTSAAFHEGERRDRSAVALRSIHDHPARRRAAELDADAQARLDESRRRLASRRGELDAHRTRIPALRFPSSQRRGAWTHRRKKWTFHLRHGVLWHDDVPFTADDVVFTLQRVSDPAVGASDRAIFSGAHAHAVDSETVEITFKAPLASPETAFDRLLILSRHRSPRGDLGMSPDATAPIGTGPLKFVSWMRGAQIDLAIWDHYWGTKSPLEKMTFRFPPTYGNVIGALQEGSVDVVPRRAERRRGHDENESCAERKIRRPARGRLELHRVGAQRFLEKLADPRVRRAIGLAVPRAKLQCEIEACNVAVTLGPLPADHPAMADIAAPHFDLAEAARDLDSAGIVDTDGDGVREMDGQPFTIHLIVPTTSTEQEKIASVVADELRKIGVRFEVLPLEWSQFRRAIELHDFELAAIEWTIDAEPDLFPLFHSTAASGSLNYGGYSNANVDRLLEALRSDTGDRNEMQHDIVTQIRDDEPYTFLFSPLIVAIVRKGRAERSADAARLGPAQLWLERESAVKRRRFAIAPRYS